MNNNDRQKGHSSRRAFLRDGSLCLLGAGATLANTDRLFADNENKAASLSVGIVTDLHYADKQAGGSRHYRETPNKLAAAAQQFKKAKPEFIVELGDFVDAAESVERELGYLNTINKQFSAICKNRHYVLGNHCVHTLTKEEFLGGVEQKKSYYSFDAGNSHFVVLDSCFRSDGMPYGRKNFQWTDPNIPSAELDWLKADLAKTNKPTVVFAHQRLDVSNHYGVKNGTAVRQVLEQSDKVSAVFQGHSHKNDYNEIGGIHYCTMVAMVEGAGKKNNGFSTLNIHNDGTLEINGFLKQKSYQWER